MAQLTRARPPSDIAVYLYAAICVAVWCVWGIRPLRPLRDRCAKANAHALGERPDASANPDPIACGGFPGWCVKRRLSRRGFLSQSALASVTTALVGPASVAETGNARSHRDGADAAESVLVSIGVNGTNRELRVEPRTTLADALRDILGLRGTKIGCNRGACSACTVWLDGAPVCSCMLLAVDAAGRQVTTIEGLADGDSLHPVQSAFIEYDAVQCGYCTPGMVMSCAALLRDMPAARVSDVQTALSGHICRCGTYPHAIAATLAAAKDQNR